MADTTTDTEQDPKKRDTFDWFGLASPQGWGYPVSKPIDAPSAEPPARDRWWEDHVDIPAAEMVPGSGRSVNWGAPADQPVSTPFGRGTAEAAPAPPPAAPPSRGTSSTWDTPGASSSWAEPDAAAPVPVETPAPWDTLGASGRVPGEDVKAALAALQPGAPPTEPSPPRPETPAGKPGPAPNPLSALNAVQRIKDMETANADQMAERAKQRKALDEATLKRRVLEEMAHTAIKDYRAAYNETRPEQPKLEKPPATPDVKIRPWLDPEGKDAISVITQTLGMMAVAGAGLALKAPLTAMQYFREAAESWRRDEVDQANSKFKKFEMEVTRQKGNNEVALKQYELADKAYAHNVDAKKAAVLTALDELKLHDEGLVATMLPYDKAVEATKENFKNLSTIETHVEKLWTIQSKLKDANAVVNKGPFAAEGEKQALIDQIANEPDPEKKAQMQRRVAVLDNQLKNSQARDLKRIEAAALVTVARTNIPKIDAQLGALDRFMGDVVRFDDAVRVLAKAGVLPSTPTPISRWAASFRNLFPSQWKDPNVQGALTIVQTLGPDLTVSYARTIENNIGVRHREAFNLPARWEMLTTAQLSTLPRFFSEGAANGRMVLEDRKKTYSQGLPTLGGAPLPSENPPEPAAGTTTETEEE